MEKGGGAGEGGWIEGKGSGEGWRSRWRWIEVEVESCECYVRGGEVEIRQSGGNQGNVVVDEG